MPPWSNRFLISLLAALLMAALPTLAAKLPLQPPPSAVASGAVDLLLLAGGGLHGPSLGLKARFRNGFELGYRHSQWQEGHAEEAGFYFMPVSSLGRIHRPYFGTEYHQANRTGFGLGSLPAFTGMSRKPAILLVAGQEHRLGSRIAVSYDAGGGVRLTPAHAGPLPPLVLQARAQMLCRLF